MSKLLGSEYCIFQGDKCMHLYATVKFKKVAYTLQAFRFKNKRYSHLFATVFTVSHLHQFINVTFTGPLAV